MTAPTTHPLVLIDGSSWLFRAFHALPPLSNSRGEPTGAVYGMANMLKRLQREYQPQRICVVFDPKGPTFRNELYDQYKANRPPPPDDLVPQVPLIRDATAAHNAQFPDYEKNVQLLNENISNWLSSHIVVEGKKIPTNVAQKYKDWTYDPKVKVPPGQEAVYWVEAFASSLQLHKTPLSIAQADRLVPGHGKEREILVRRGSECQPLLPLRIRSLRLQGERAAECIGCISKRAKPDGLVGLPFRGVNGANGRHCVCVPAKPSGLTRPRHRIAGGATRRISGRDH